MADSLPLLLPGEGEGMPPLRPTWAVGVTPGSGSEADGGGLSSTGGMDNTMARPIALRAMELPPTAVRGRALELEMTLSEGSAAHCWEGGPGDADEVWGVAKDDISEPRAKLCCRPSRDLVGFSSSPELLRARSGRRPVEEPSRNFEGRLWAVRKSPPEEPEVALGLSGGV